MSERDWTGELVEALRDQAQTLAPGIMQSGVVERIEWQAAQTIEDLRQMGMETERLRELNAELVDVLREGMSVQRSDAVGVEYRKAILQWLRDASTVIAKAESVDE